MQKFLISVALINIFTYLFTCEAYLDNDEEEPEICNETSFTVLRNVLGIKGGYINLDCSEVCLRSPAIWTKASSKIAKLERIDYKNSEKIKINWKEYSIIIKNLTQEDEGHYFCSRNNSYFNQYVLDVVDDEPLDIMLYNSQKPQEPITWIAKDDKMSDVILSITYRWGIWSECSRCDAVGMRKIIGLNSITTANIKDGSPLIDEGKDVLIWNLLSMGLSPKSYVIPRWLLNDATFQANKNRKSIVIYKACQVACSNDSYDAFKDFRNKKLGDLVRVAGKETVSTEVGSTVILGCPGLKRGNDSVVWKKGRRIIDALVVPFTTKRKFIDHLGQFRIENVSESDRGIYSCSLPNQDESNQIVAISRLVVRTAIPEKPVNYASEIIFTSATLIIVFYIANSINNNRKHNIG